MGYCTRRPVCILPPACPAPMEEGIKDLCQLSEQLGLHSKTVIFTGNLFIWPCPVLILVPAHCSVLFIWSLQYYLVGLATILEDGSFRCLQEDTKDWAWHLLNSTEPLNVRINSILWILGYREDTTRWGDPHCEPLLSPTLAITKDTLGAHQLHSVPSDCTFGLDLKEEKCLYFVKQNCDVFLNRQWCSSALKRGSN